MIRMLSLIMMSSFLFACQAQSFEKIDTKTYKTLAQEEDVYVIDVRTPDEVNAGYILESDYFFNYYDANFKANVAELDTTKTYIVYCRSGKRSTAALQYMASQGFTHLYELGGGILSWQDAEWIETK